MLYYEYLKMIGDNIFVGSKTKQLSVKYKLAATPSSKTFSIWSVIFTGIWWFLWNRRFTHEQSKKLEISFRLIREWLNAFVEEEDLLKANKIIRQLKNLNNEIAMEYDNHYITMFAEWVGVAALLNENIVSVHIDGKPDFSLEHLIQYIKMRDKSTLNESQKTTLVWTVQGFAKGVIPTELLSQLNPPSSPITWRELFDKKDRLY